jgi:hypothetical protein
MRYRAHIDLLRELEQAIYDFKTFQGEGLPRLADPPAPSEDFTHAKAQLADSHRVIEGNRWRRIKVAMGLDELVVIVKAPTGVSFYEEGHLNMIDAGSADPDEDKVEW